MNCKVDIKKVITSVGEAEPETRILAFLGSRSQKNIWSRNQIC